MTINNNEKFIRVKFIQTLNVHSEYSFKCGFGWAAPHFHLMGWALSCLQLNKICQRVELYANTYAAKLLIETLELPYSKVHTLHDEFLIANENLWALYKIFT